MPDKPLVSVVVPVYNHADYVEEALRSVIGQDYRPVELIVIDDGSKDASVEVARRVVEGPLPEGVSASLRTRPNKGAQATLKEGLDAAQGTWLTILNSDDAYEPTRLSRCVASAQASGSRLLVTYVEAIDGDGAPLPVEHYWRQWYADGILQELDSAASFSTLLLSRNMTVSTGNMVFHRDLWAKLGGFGDFRYAHDVDFVLRAAITDEPYLLREPLYKYRLHGHNTITESDAATEKEYETIVHNYFRRTLEKPVENPFAPTLDSWGATFAATPWPPHVLRAMDRLLDDGTPDGGALKNDTTDDPPELPAIRPERGRVTLLSHELTYTGAPVLLRDVATALRRRGISGNMVSLQPGPLGKDFARIGFPDRPQSKLVHRGALIGRMFGRLVHEPKMPAILRRVAGRLSWLFLGVSGRFHMWDTMRHLDRDTPLLINSFASWPVALRMIDRWRGPVLWYVHETYDPSVLMRDGQALARLRELVADKRVQMVFGSDATRAVWARAGLDGKVRYWSGLPKLPPEAAPFVERGKDAPFVFLSVQSAGTRKGTRALVEAFAHGRRTGSLPDNAQLRIIGCPAPSTFAFTRDLLARVAAPDLAGSVRLVGSLAPSALAHHYGEADAYVQSSIMECLPLALLTAMQHGLPIVSTDADGCREAIEDGVTGLLVPSRALEPMAQALARLAGDAALRRQLGHGAAQRFADMFSLEATADVLVADLVPQAVLHKGATAPLQKG